MPTKKPGKQYLWEYSMGGWSSKEKRRHINDSGLTGVKLALFASTGGGLLNPIHLQIKNTNPIS